MKMKFLKSRKLFLKDFHSTTQSRAGLIILNDLLEFPLLRDNIGYW
jgi:hypothetical protein